MDRDAWSSTHSCELETGLSDAKAMFKAKFCEDIDDDNEAEEPVWTVTRGAAPTRAKLETGLCEVKAMVKAKFGEDIDDDDEAEEPVWTVTRGAAPLRAKLELGLSLR